MSSLKSMVRVPFQENLDRVGEEQWYHRPFLCFARKPVEIDLDDLFKVERLNSDGTTTILPIPEDFRETLKFEPLGEL